MIQFGAQHTYIYHRMCKHANRVRTHYDELAQHLMPEPKATLPIDCPGALDASTRTQWGVCAMKLN